MRASSTIGYLAGESGHVVSCEEIRNREENIISKPVIDEKRPFSKDYGFIIES